VDNYRQEGTRTGPELTTPALFLCVQAERPVCMGDWEEGKYTGALYLICGDAFQIGRFLRVIL